MQPAEQEHEFSLMDNCPENSLCHGLLPKAAVIVLSHSNASRTKSLDQDQDDRRTGAAKEGQPVHLNVNRGTSTQQTLSIARARTPGKFVREQS